MIFSAPVNFDENEWFVISGLVVLLLIFILIPKHFPPALTLVILIFTVNLGITTDYILAAEYPFNFYDALDTNKFDLFDFIMSNINYGLFGYLFLHFYDKWQVRGIIRIMYILFWIILSLTMEFVSVKLNVIKYNGWKLEFSFICYLFIFALYIIFLKVGKMAIHQYKKKQIAVLNN